MTSGDNILFTNDAFLEMLEVPPDMVASGNSMSNYFDYCQARGDYGTEENAIAARSRIAKFHEDGTAHSLERQTHSGRWLRIDAKPTENRLMIITYTDITEAKIREADLQEGGDRGPREIGVSCQYEP